MNYRALFNMSVTALALVRSMRQTITDIFKTEKLTDELRAK